MPRHGVEMLRQAETVELLVERGFASVLDLARHFDVSESTIRRSLKELESRGLVRRTHGGALATRQNDALSDLHETEHRDEKRAIGQAMAQRILPGQTVLLDRGSTTLEVARHIDAPRVTVVTNDLLIGTTIARQQNAHLVFVGGELLPNEYAMWGPTSIQQLENLRVNVAVFGADTVTENGIYNTSSYEIEVKRKMRAIASEAFFVADSSKFGREALFRVFDFDAFTAGITDERMPAMRAAQFPVPLIISRLSPRPNG